MSENSISSKSKNNSDYLQIIADLRQRLFDANQHNSSLQQLTTTLQQEINQIQQQIQTQNPPTTTPIKSGSQPQPDTTPSLKPEREILYVIL